MHKRDILESKYGERSPYPYCVLARMRPPWSREAFWIIAGNTEIKFDKFYNPWADGATIWVFGC